ncbi:MAG: hypothetical protein GEV28_12010 [Actinophytocola sp.]|uniref:hypothetical protein n=1 Tax=Actinophytocola sp. TaxID=1872138 RepID=UPI001326DB80|nr:hypothetical protein [Actinophytocola sp.]MPZ81066.1 hypothetical protein [Actinophytocola sp.]
MKLAAIQGVTPVSVQSVEATERALTDSMIEVRGRDSAHDPGIALAARDAAELAHANGAGLVAVVTHQNADPAILVGMVVTADAPLGPDAAAELRHYLADAGSADIREVTESRTERGYPVVIAERLVVDGPSRTGLPSGCQLQAVVIDPTGKRMAVFTLHSTTGRGWLELATVLGRLVSSVDFEVAPNDPRMRVSSGR